MWSMLLSVPAVQELPDPVLHYFSIEKYYKENKRAGVILQTGQGCLCGSVSKPPSGLVFKSQGRPAQTGSGSW
jgi:hypothetical protein